MEPVCQFFIVAYDKEDGSVGYINEDAERQPIRVDSVERAAGCKWYGDADNLLKKALKRKENNIRDLNSNFRRIKNFRIMVVEHFVRELEGDELFELMKKSIKEKASPTEREFLEEFGF